jgi:predicted nucleic acid-binding protein
VAATPESGAIRQVLAADDEHAAPHLVDAEVLAVITAHHRRGDLDDTAASLAVADLTAWPGERWSHRTFLARAWELRDDVRGYDALYVALAEAMDATLVTLDRRLARAPGIRCRIDVL